MFSQILPIFTKKASNHINILISSDVCVQFICAWRNKPNSIKLDLLEGIVEGGYA